MPDDGSYIQNFRSVQELLIAFYGNGFITEPVESDYTIGTTATVLGSSKLGQRVSRMVSNTGSGNFAVSYNPAVAITTGGLLLPGGVFVDDWYYDGDLVSRPLYAICSAAGGTLHMIERVLTGA